MKLSITGLSEQKNHNMAKKNRLESSFRRFFLVMEHKGLEPSTP